MKKGQTVFQQPKYLQNSFSIVFPRKSTIRRSVFEFENKLQDLYIQPQIISIPDEINPEMPRIVFTSKHDHSQIIISQINFILNVSYSRDWQFDIAKGKEYVFNRVSILFELLELIGEKCPYFCGFNTLVQIPAQDENSERTISHIYSLFSNQINPFSSDIYEFHLKTSKVVEQEFFSNITIQNYRSWNVAKLEGILKLSSKAIVETGIQIEGDFNDRYAFNESENYCSIENQARKVIELGLDAVNTTIEQIIGSQ